MVLCCCMRGDHEWIPLETKTVRVGTATFELVTVVYCKHCKTTVEIPRTDTANPI